MAKSFALKAEPRERAGKGAARALRREKKIPAVIYGDKKEPVKITLDERELTLEYVKGHMFTSLCDMNVGNEKHSVLARDIQLHPVKDTVEHIDFLRVTPNTKLAVNIPVEFINQEECYGLTEEKGVLNVVRYDVEMVCKAVNIPDSIQVDIKDFKLGDAIKISDAALPEGAKPVIDDRDFTLATIVAPRAAVEETEEEEGAEGEAAEDEEGTEGAEGEEGGEEKAEGEEAAGEE